MKKIVFIFYILNFCNNLHSQESIIKIYAIDSFGNTDTLIFGHKDNSQIGVDTLLGEENFFGTPLGELDLRIRQRDSANVSCGRIESLETDVFWDNNLDLKKDFRPYIGFDGFQNNTFELSFHSNSFPVYLSFDYSELGALSNNVLLTGKDVECLEVIIVGTVMTNNSQDSLYTDSFENSYFYSFESFDADVYIVNIDENYEMSSRIDVYPNPFSEYLNIRTNFSGDMIFYNSLGEQVHAERIDNSQQEINLSDLNSGLYYIHFFNEETGKSSLEKIMKY